MKFKDWFSTLDEEIIKDSVFKCVGHCDKWFFYATDNPEEGVPAKQLIEDIKNGWGPADYKLLKVEDIHFNEDDNKIWFICDCEHK